MKRQIYILLFISFLLNCSNIKAQTFNNRYEFNGWPDAAYSVVEVDSGYYVVGYIFDSLYWYMSVEVMYLDTVGNKVWDKEYGEPYYYNIPGPNGSFIQTNDGGFIMGGAIEDTLLNYDAKIFRFDKYGDTLWTKVYGDTAYYQSFTQCKQTPDSGFVFIGSNLAFDSDGDFWLVKTDSLGNMEWEQTYGGTQLESGLSVDICDDGGYILAGKTKSYGPGAGVKNNFYVVKTDSLGNTDWTQVFGGPYGETAFNVAQTSDDGFIVCGALTDTVISGDNYGQPYLIKLDSAGNTVWDKTYGPVSWEFGFQMVRELNNGDFIGVGTNGLGMSFIMKMNTNGDSIWYRDHELEPGPGGTNIFQDVQPTSDNGYIAVGWHVSSPSQDMWVVKMDSMGCVVSGCDTVTSVTELTDEHFINIYPNPATGEFTLEYKFPDATESGVFMMYDITGKKVVERQVSGSKGKVIIPVNGCSSGLYLYSIQIDGRPIADGKIVIQE